LCSYPAAINHLIRTKHEIGYGNASHVTKWQHTILTMADWLEIMLAEIMNWNGFKVSLLQILSVQ